MPMQTVQVRLTPDQIESIDQKVKNGCYQSRSEAIRDYIRKAEFFEVLAQFRKLTQEAGLKEEDVWQDDEEIRKELFQKLIVKTS